MDLGDNVNDSNDTKSSIDANARGGDSAPRPAPPVSKPVSKSPLFEAFNATRYQRQTLIRQLEQSTGRRVISYTAAAGAPIDRDDVMPFVDLLHPIEEGANVDLLLHTGGGDIDATEKLASMLWARIGGSGTLRVVVPDMAKSAGTLLALAADSIVMSDSSDLGPIDPQRVQHRSDGTVHVLAVHHHLDAYDRCVEAVRDNPTDVTACMMLNKFDPAEIESFRVIMDRARQLSDKHLKEGMLRKSGGGTFTAITSQLIDTNRWLTHSQMIGHNEAEQIGLMVEYLEPNDPTWELIWRLHCLQRLAVGGDGARKLFESDLVSLQLS
jgi:Serine dehydrogenase proteinase